MAEIGPTRIDAGKIAFYARSSNVSCNKIKIANVSIISLQSEDTTLTLREQRTTKCVFWRETILNVTK
jgi:hypothetical protein